MPPSHMFRTKVRVNVTTALMICLTTSGCFAIRAQISNLSSNGACEEAEKNLQRLEIPARAWGTANQGVGSVISVGYAGLGYAHDGFVIVIGQTILPVVICTIAVPLDIWMFLSFHSGFYSSDACSASLNQRNQRWKSIGEKNYEKTAQLRDLDLTPFSEAVREVSACYKKRGDKENHQHAWQLLLQIRENPEIFTGLTPLEKQKVLLAIDDFRPKELRQPSEPTRVPAPAASSGEINPKLDSNKLFILGEWQSSEGVFLSGGTKTDLDGKAIAGITAIRIDPDMISWDFGHFDNQKIRFATNDPTARSIFAAQLAGSPNQHAIVEYTARKIYEFFVIGKDGDHMESFRYVPYYSSEDRPMMIKRRWERIKTVPPLNENS